MLTPMAKPDKVVSKVCTAFGQITSQRRTNIGTISLGRGTTNFETFKARQAASQSSSSSRTKAIGLTTVRSVRLEMVCMRAKPFQP